MELLKYLEKEFGISVPGKVTWSHAVNSVEKLQRVLKEPEIMMIESDIRISSQGVPVAVHPPETESDLSFDYLLNQMRNSKKGLKLDFKDPEILIPCLQKLQNSNLHQPVILNADILEGNGANPSKFNSLDFLESCKKYFSVGLLSVGWTTIADPDFAYTQQNIEEMQNLIGNFSEVTFPVRACLLPSSWTQLTKLIQPQGFTLSVWNNEPIDKKLSEWIKVNTNPRKTFYDFIDENKDPLKLW
jgi:hypothetical protein